MFFYVKSFDVLEWLIKIHKIKIDPIIYRSASKNDNLDILKWYWPQHKQINDKISKIIVINAIENNNMEIINWLRTDHVDLSDPESFNDNLENDSPHEDYTYYYGSESL
jgi:hypothetical protein